MSGTRSLLSQFVFPFFGGFAFLLYGIVWTSRFAAIRGSGSLAVVTLAAGFATAVLPGVYARFCSSGPSNSQAIFHFCAAVFAGITVFIDHPIWILLFVFATALSSGINLTLFCDTTRLYGVFAAGCATAVPLAGILFLPFLGSNKTIFLGGAINIGLALISLFSLQENRSEPPRVAFRPLYLLFLFSGFVIVAYEILWIRALRLFAAGGSYISYSTLIAFLTGIAAGIIYYSRTASLRSAAYQFYSLIQFRMALSAMFFIGIFAAIPFALFALQQNTYPCGWLFLLGQSVLILILLFYPSFFGGAVLLTALEFRPLGPLYSIIGIILSILYTDRLIPPVGVERLLRILAICNLIAGIFFFRKSRPAQQDRRVLAIGGAVLALLLFLPAWNRSILNAGYYLRSPQYAGKMRASARSLEALKPLFYADGRKASVSVLERKNIRTLLIDGKPAASNEETELQIEMLIVRHAMELKKEISRSLLLRLRSGTLAGAFAVGGGRENDCVEPEREVARAATYFVEENGSVLTKKNFHLYFDDPRSFLTRTQNRYDLIVFEFDPRETTREFFYLVRNRLTEGGVLYAWLPLAGITVEDAGVLIKTFESVFPRIGIWLYQDHLLLAGGKQPIDSTVLPDYYAGNESLAKFFARKAAVNTDDLQVLERNISGRIFSDDSAATIRRAILSASPKKSR